MNLSCLIFLGFGDSSKNARWPQLGAAIPGLRSKALGAGCLWDFPLTSGGVTLSSDQGDGVFGACEVKSTQWSVIMARYYWSTHHKALRAHTHTHTHTHTVVYHTCNHLMKKRNNFNINVLMLSTQYTEAICHAGTHTHTHTHTHTYGDYNLKHEV